MQVLRSLSVVMVLAGCSGGTSVVDTSSGPSTTAGGDEDGDGFAAGDDCDDADATVFPGAVEECDGKDTDCDGVVPVLETIDWDLDGSLACVDCDDGNGQVFEAQTVYQDFDGDGYGDPTVTDEACGPKVGFVTNSSDCDDLNPGAHERTEFYADADGDGYGDPEVTTMSCGMPTGYVSDDTDCDDTDGEAYPGQIWYLDLDEDGYGNPDVWVEICAMPEGTWVNDDNSDCDDLDAHAFPGAIWYPDSDGDGWGTDGDPLYQCLRPDGYGATDEDCNDSDPTLFPGQLWAPDEDGDGYGDMTSVVESCGPPSSGWIEDATDCNDTEAGVYPGSTEVCDGFDTDCDGKLPSDEEDADGDGYSICDGDEDDSDPKTYPILYEFSGILTWVAESTLIGWELCHVDYYSGSGTPFSSISSGCSKSKWLVGCRVTGDTTLITAANAPVSDVQYWTGTSNSGHIANGVEWYWDDTYSVGYVEPGDGMSRNSCDTHSGSYPDRRLCWHAGSGNIQGGYRCGSATGLNSSTSYERVIYHAN